MSIRAGPVRRCDDTTPMPTEGHAVPNPIFVNLPVKDFDRSVAFFTAPGFSFNPKFAARNASCMVCRMLSS
jgi:hypothetical protein